MTPILSLGVLQGLQSVFSNSHFQILTTENLRKRSVYPYLLSFLKFSRLRICKRWCYVSHSVSRLTGVKRSVTHTSDCVACRIEQKRHSTLFKPLMKGMNVMLPIEIKKLREYDQGRHSYSMGHIRWWGL